MRTALLLPCLLATASLVGCAEGPTPPAGPTSGPHGGDTAGFVTSAACASCHAEISERWHGSHHDLAMQEATEETVLGDFDDATFEWNGRTTRFSRDGEAFLVQTEGPDGELHDYEVAYTFGVEPLQQYLIPFPGGRYQCLDIAWDTERNRWFDLNPEERVPADDPYHWTGRFQSWNHQCADCHSTYLARNYEPETDSYDTTWEDLDVGCEACHGPGGEHVRLAASWGGERPEDAPSGFASLLARDDQQAILNTCAPCHSRRTATVNSHMPGAPFHDDYLLARLTPDLYHADGQIEEEVYVHGSFVQSKMYMRGVSCVDCHDPHSLDLWLPGDAVCTQCHSTNPPTDRFPTLQARRYDDPEHHHHPQESEGARCVSCHMPENTYMVIDDRRDHSLRIPRPDLAAVLDTPDACTSCHEDREPSWAAEAIRDWTEEAPGFHYGLALGVGQDSPPELFQALLALPGDEETPPLVRATALELLPPGSQVTMQAAAGLVLAGDADPLVLASALIALQGAPPELLAAVVPAQLEHENRQVRMQAAQLLAGQGEARLDESQRAAFDAALAEFEAMQAANADAPFAWLNLGVVQERRGRNAEAKRSYRKALDLDARFLPAVFNLATLLSTTGDGATAERVLEAALELDPEEGELHYSLGLLRAELGNLEGCAEALEAASERLPDRPRIHFNRGLALLQLGRSGPAEKALLRAASLAPGDPDLIHGLATFYLEQNQLELAEEWTRRLMQAVPQAPGPAELLAEIERRMAERDAK